MDIDVDIDVGIDVCLIIGCIVIIDYAVN